MALEFQSIATPASTGDSLSFGWLQAKPTAADRTFFTEQLVLMLSASTPLHRALITLRGQSSGAMRRVIERIEAQVEAGRSFSDALSHEKQLFSTTYVNLIRASETGGFMDEALEQLIVMENRRTEMTRTVSSAMIYPAFLALFSVIVVVFVLTMVFPRFAVMFARVEDELPASTLFFMGASDLLVLHWPWLLAGIGIAVAFGWALLGNPQVRERFDRLRLTAPFIGGVFVQLYLVQCLHVMSLSLRHGVSITDTLAACRDVVDNAAFRGLILDVERRVHAGGSLAAGFRDATFIPEMVRQMLSTGEESGNLAQVMSRIAGYYEVQLTARLQAASRMAEPVMLLFMGALVGMIVSSLILPIFKLSGAA